MIFTGPSSGGKSKRLHTPLKLFPPEAVITRSSFSKKALNFGEGSLDGKILAITEYRGGREAHLQLRILQSEGEVGHEYTQGGKTKVVKRDGTPVVLTSATDEPIYEDDSTRFLQLRVDPTPDEILAVLKSALVGAVESDDLGLEVWHEAIRQLKPVEQATEFPKWLEYVAELVPRNQPGAQRDWKRVLAFMQAVALCRPNSDGCIGLEDYCVTFKLLNPALTATVNAVSEKELAVKNAVDKLNAEMEGGVSFKQLKQSLRWSQTMTHNYVRAAEFGPPRSIS